MKYFASFAANNGGVYSGEPYEYTSKTKAIKEDIGAKVVGYHYKQTGNKSTYCVWGENGICVAQGTLYSFGQWRRDEDAIGHNYKEV